MGLINLDTYADDLEFHRGVYLKAKLFVYRAGTDTLSPIYRDRNLTVTRQNPLSIASNERLPIGYLLDGTYRFVIRDSRGDTIDVLDNVVVNARAESGVLRGFSSVGDLLRDTTLAYSADNAGVQASPGDVLSVVQWGYLYEVAPEIEAAPHLITAGGVKLFVKPQNGEVAVDAFGDDYDDALEQAILAASALGAEVIHQAGGKYVSSRGVLVSDVPVRVDFRGAEVARTTADAPILDATYSYSDVTPITDITTTTVNFGGGGTLCQRLHVAPGSALLTAIESGDVIKLVSDQFIPSSPPSSNERLGEQANVAEVDAGAGHIDIFGLLREDFVLAGNNVRVARASKLGCQIKGLLATSSALHEPLIRVTGAVRPEIEIKAEGAYCPALALISCYRPIATVRARGLMTNAALNQYGYGVVSYGCNLGRYDVTAERVRHAWTSGARGVLEAASSDIALYGGSIDEHVFVDTTDCYGAGFDTHSDALGTVARGVVRNAFPGDSTSNTCVQLRGRDCDINITTVGLRAARVDIFGAGGGHRMHICHQRPHNYNSSLPIVSIEGDPANDRQEVNLRLTNASGGGQFPLITAQDCRLNVRELSSKDVRSGTGSLRPVVVNAENAAVEVQNWAIDWKSSDGNLTPALARVDGESDVTLRNGTVTRGSATYFLADLRNSGGSVNIDGVEVDHMPNAPVNAGSQNWQVRRLTHNSVALEDLLVENGNSNGAAGALEGRIQRLSVPITAQRTIALPTSGVYAGMRYDFIRTQEAAGASAWLITAGGGNNFALYAGSRMSVLYDGSAWEVVRREGFLGVRKRADESPVMSGNSETTQIFEAPLTANRTLRLPNVPGFYHVRRSETATGGFDLTVANASGGAIHALSGPGAWVQVVVSDSTEDVIANS